MEVIFQSGSMTSHICHVFTAEISKFAPQNRLCFWCRLFLWNWWTHVQMQIDSGKY